MFTLLCCPPGFSRLLGPVHVPYHSLMGVYQRPLGSQELGGGAGPVKGLGAAGSPHPNLPFEAPSIRSSSAFSSATSAEEVMVGGTGGAGGGAIGRQSTELGDGAGAGRLRLLGRVDLGGASWGTVPPPPAVSAAFEAGNHSNGHTTSYTSISRPPSRSTGHITTHGGSHAGHAGHTTITTQPVPSSSGVLPAPANTLGLPSVLGLIGVGTGKGVEEGKLYRSELDRWAESLGVQGHSPHAHAWAVHRPGEAVWGGAGMGAAAGCQVSVRPCRYFLAGFCRDGERCRFSHVGQARMVGLGAASAHSMLSPVPSKLGQGGYGYSMKLGGGHDMEGELSHGHPQLPDDLT